MGSRVGVLYEGSGKQEAVEGGAGLRADRQREGQPGQREWLVHSRKVPSRGVAVRSVMCLWLKNVRMGGRAVRPGRPPLPGPCVSVCLPRECGLSLVDGRWFGPRDGF